MELIDTVQNQGQGSLIDPTKIQVSESECGSEYTYYEPRFSDMDNSSVPLRSNRKRNRSNYESGALKAQEDRIEKLFRENYGGPIVLASIKDKEKTDSGFAITNWFKSVE